VKRKRGKRKKKRLRVWGVHPLTNQKRGREKNDVGRNKKDDDGGGGMNERGRKGTLKGGGRYEQSKVVQWN